MENIEFSHVQLSLAREISVSQKNNILTDRIFLQISGRKQISAQPIINGTTVQQTPSRLPTILPNCTQKTGHQTLLEETKLVMSS
jgi:hypothetical protein